MKLFFAFLVPELFLPCRSVGIMMLCLLFSIGSVYKHGKKWNLHNVKCTATNMSRFSAVVLTCL